MEPEPPGAAFFTLEAEPEPKSAPGPWPPGAGAGASQKSGGSATLQPIEYYLIHIQPKQSQSRFRVMRLNFLRCHFTQSVGQGAFGMSGEILRLSVNKLN